MFHSLAPVFIGAPVHRSGTTLLQRLLCSAPNALIFGETLANDMNFFASMLQNKKVLLSGASNWRAEQLEQVLQGDVNEWIPDILPDKDWVIKNFEQVMFSYLNGFAQFAKEKGRQHWGAKLPAWTPAILQQLLELMPKAKLLYIVRDIESCVRSAKLIGYCADINAVHQYASMWVQYQRMVRQFCPPQQVLFIDYQELCETPGRIIQAIEAFTGIAPIDSGVMEHRINNYNRIREAPPKLNDEERRLLTAFKKE